MEAEVQTISIENMRKRINKYSRSYAASWVAGEIKPKNNGDCWHCLMHDDHNVPMGDIGFHDTETVPEHYLTHMSEKYYPFALLYNACVWDQQRLAPLFKHYIGVFTQTGALPPQWGKDYMDSEIRELLRRFLRNRCRVAKTDYRHSF